MNTTRPVLSLPVHSLFFDNSDLASDEQRMLFVQLFQHPLTISAIPMVKNWRTMLYGRPDTDDNVIEIFGRLISKGLVSIKAYDAIDFFLVEEFIKVVRHRFPSLSARRFIIAHMSWDVQVFQPGFQMGNTIPFMQHLLYFARQYSKTGVLTNWMADFCYVETQPFEVNVPVTTISCRTSLRDIQLASPVVKPYPSSNHFTIPETKVVCLLPPIEALNESVVHIQRDGTPVLEDEVHQQEAILGKKPIVAGTQKNIRKKGWTDNQYTFSKDWFRFWGSSRLRTDAECRQASIPPQRPQDKKLEALYGTQRILRAGTESFGKVISQISRLRPVREFGSYYDLSCSGHMIDLAKKYEQYVHSVIRRDKATMLARDKALTKWMRQGKHRLYFIKLGQLAGNKEFAYCLDLWNMKRSKDDQENIYATPQATQEEAATCVLVALLVYYYSQSPVLAGMFSLATYLGFQKVLPAVKRDYVSAKGYANEIRKRTKQAFRTFDRSAETFERVAQHVDERVDQMAVVVQQIADTNVQAQIAIDRLNGIFDRPHESTLGQIFTWFTTIKGAIERFLGPVYSFLTTTFVGKFILLMLTFVILLVILRFIATSVTFTLVEAFAAFLSPLADFLGLRRLFNHFGSQPEPQAGDEVTDATVFDVMTSFISGSFGKAKSVFKRAGEVLPTFHRVGQAVEWFVQRITKYYAWFMSWWTGEPYPSNSIEAVIWERHVQLREKKEYADAHLGWTATFRNDPTFMFECKSLKAHMYATFLLAGKPSSKLNPVFNALVASDRMLTDEMASALSVAAKLAKPRALPVWVNIFGKPGMGKTEITKEIMHKLHLTMGAQFPDRKAFQGPFNDGLVYTYPHGDAFWDGYAEQPYYMVDDLLQSRDSTVRSSFCSNWMTINSSLPCSVLVADPNLKKQNIQFLSEFIFTTCNDPYQLDLGITSPEAFWTRAALTLELKSRDGQKYFVIRPSIRMGKIPEVVLNGVKKTELSVDEVVAICVEAWKAFQISVVPCVYNPIPALPKVSISHARVHFGDASVGEEFDVKPSPPPPKTVHMETYASPQSPGLAPMVYTPLLADFDMIPASPALKEARQAALERELLQFSDEAVPDVEEGPPDGKAERQAGKISPSGTDEYQILFDYYLGMGRADWTPWLTPKGVHRDKLGKESITRGNIIWLLREFYPLHAFFCAGYTKEELTPLYERFVRLFIGIHNPETDTRVPLIPQEHVWNQLPKEFRARLIDDFVDPYEDGAVNDGRTGRKWLDIPMIQALCSPFTGYRWPVTCDEIAYEAFMRDNPKAKGRFTYKTFCQTWQLRFFFSILLKAVVVLVGVHVVVGAVRLLIGFVSTSLLGYDIEEQASSKLGGEFKRRPTVTQVAKPKGKPHVVSHNISRQSGDGSGLEQVLRKNIVPLSFGDQRCYGLALCKDLVVVPRHCVQDCDEDTIVMQAPNGDGAMVEYRWNDIIEYKHGSEYDDEICFLQFPTATHWKNITNHFSDARIGEGNICRLRPYIDDSPNTNKIFEKVCSNRIDLMSDEVEGGHFKRHTLGASIKIFDMDNAKGMCGAPYYFNSGFPAPHIVGIHTAGIPAQRVSMACRIPKCVVDEIVAERDKEAAKIGKLELEPKDIEHQGLKYPMPERMIHTPGVHCYAVVPRHLAYKVDHPPGIVPSDLHPKHAARDDEGILSLEHEPTRVPATPFPHVNKAGETIHPLSETLNKFARLGFKDGQPFWNITGPVNRDHLAEIPWELLCPPSYNFTKLSIVPVEECITGSNRVAACQLNTSPGFGYTQAGLTRLDVLFKHGEVRKEFVDKCDALEEKLADNVVPMIVLACSKSELISKEDYEKGKCRIFCAAQLEYVLLTRKYLGMFIDAMEAVPWSTPIAIGVNPASIEWGLLHARLSEGGAHAMAGDFKGYEYSIPDWARELMVECIERLWPLTDLKQRRIRANLIRSILCVDMLFRDRLFTMQKGEGSGHPLTAWLNSLINWILHYLCFRHVGYKKEDFAAKVKFAAVGDDSVAGIIAAPLMNMLAMEEFTEMIGMRYTSPTKGDIKQPYLDWHDVDFLKRKFVWRDNYCFAPLALESILEAPMWLTEKSKDPEGDMVNTLRSVLLEMRHYDKSLHDRVRKVVIRWAKVHKVHIPVTDFGVGLRQLRGAEIQHDTTTDDAM